MLGLHCCTAGLSLVVVSGQLVVFHCHLYQLSFWDLLPPDAVFSRQCTGVSVPLRDVLSSTGLPSKWCAGAWAAELVSSKTWWVSQAGGRVQGFARTRSPSPRAWRPDFPGAAREAP